MFGSHRVVQYLLCELLTIYLFVCMCCALHIIICILHIWCIHSIFSFFFTCHTALGQLPLASQIDHKAQIPFTTHPSTSANGGRPLPVSATTSIPQLAYSSVPFSNTSGHPVPMVATTTSNPVGSSTTSPATNQDLVFISLGLHLFQRSSLIE